MIAETPTNSSCAVQILKTTGTLAPSRPKKHPWHPSTPPALRNTPGTMAPWHPPFKKHPLAPWHPPALRNIPETPLAPSRPKKHPWHLPALRNTPGNLASFRPQEPWHSGASYRPQKNPWPPAASPWASSNPGNLTTTLEITHPDILASYHPPPPSPTPTPPSPAAAKRD
ncbi:uncharacterized protein [Penaeus vannamei]|uniref:uncharacterized protein n=1 Tax=Penaeus vannamei TaxID=6689 RepID=UPI00387F6F6E